MFPVPYHNMLTLGSYDIYRKVLIGTFTILRVEREEMGRYIL